MQPIHLFLVTAITIILIDQAGQPRGQNQASTAGAEN